jgi:Ala-tRNA(Pro) deacylase
MAVLTRLKQYLEENKVEFEVHPHPETFTAQEIAAALHVPGKELAKVVMVKGTKGFMMVVLPASYKIDWEKFKDATNEPEARLASEAEFKDLFPDCEVGAMPPFGNLYDLPLYADQSLTDNSWILFQAGNHIDTVKMNYNDFVRLTQPKMEDFAVHL